MATEASYKGHRYPVEIISHCVWLYYRFALSLRDISEMMLERGVVVSHETVRQWCAKFGQGYANQLRRRRPRPGDKWHVDEVFIRINGKHHYLWRAVDQDGNVLDVLVQSRRNALAAKKFFRPTAQGTAVRAAGACHRQARQPPARPPRGDALGGTPAIEVSEQPGRELASTDPATRAGEETVHLAPACATVPVRVQPHLATFPSASASAVGHRMAPRDGRPLHRLEPDHRGDHDRRLNVNGDRAFHQNRRTTRGR